MDNPTDETDKGDVMIHETNCNLRELVGSDFVLSALVTEERITACEALLNTASDEFFIDAAADLAALRELAGKDAEEAILVHAYNIKSHAKVLGLTLVTDTCMHLVETMTSQKISAEKKYALAVKLVEILTLCFERQIRDDGGETGLQLRKKLEAFL